MRSFKYCYRLKKVYISLDSQLTNIDDLPRIITSITIPAGIKEFSTLAFFECKQLRIIEIHKDFQNKNFQIKSAFYSSKKAIIMIPVKLSDYFMKTSQQEQEKEEDNSN